MLHSDICGSLSAYDSPQLFAVCRVLLRLLMPRHSPCALSSLTSFWPLCCSHNASSLQQDSKLYLTHRSRFFIFPDALSDISLAFLAFHNYSVFKIPGVHAPHELFPCFRMCFPQTFRFELVGSSGLEPPTSRLSGVRSNHLSYEPMFLVSAFYHCFPPAKMLVEMRRFELLTPCVQGRCSPS